MYAVSLLRGLSPLSLSIIVCVALLVFTRGIHADGVIDTFDGFLSGKRGREEILAVMKDSRLGALGFTGALCVYLVKIALLYELLQRLSRDPLIYLALPPVLSRGGVAFHAWLFPPASGREGLGKSFRSSVRFRHVVTSFLLTEVFSLRPGDWRTLMLAPPVLLFWAGWGALCMRKIGGITGDTMGAGVELAEVLSFLLVLLIVFNKG